MRVGHEALADATADAPEAPERVQLVAAAAVGAADAVAASATTATEMKEPNILRKVAMSDERVGWNETWRLGRYHLHAWRTSLYIRSLANEAKHSFSPILDQKPADTDHVRYYSVAIYPMCPT